MGTSLPPVQNMQPAISITSTSQTTLPSNYNNQTSNQPMTPETNSNTMENNLSARPQVPVSPNNPCPFLRMLVANGELPNGESDIHKVNQAIDKVVAVRDRPQKIPAGFDMGIKSVAVTGNGLSPRQIAHNLRHGVKLDNLRYHIFDKRGNGTRLLNEKGEFVPTEMQRLSSFASLKISPQGEQEMGLNDKEITAMMNDNYRRAKGYRKGFDRLLMEAEFPVLLKVIGIEGRNERYLSLADVERLFKERRLPERMEKRLES